MKIEERMFRCTAGCGTIHGTEVAENRRERARRNGGDLFICPDCEEGRLEVHPDRDAYAQQRPY